MLSIIVPTLNEEKYLSLLLKSIKVQRLNKEYEIIVADAGSEDKTIEIAKNYGCKIVKGGLPAKGRNEGARVAKGDLFLFLDGDTILPEKFFERTLKEFEERNLDIATFLLEPHSNKKSQKFLFNFFYNWPILILEKILAHGAQAILVKREIFEKTSGFDEKIKFAEDHNFVRRGRKCNLTGSRSKRQGKFGVIRSTKVFSSLRRFKKDGWIRTYLKYILAELYMIFFGGIKKDIFEYKFGNYK